MRTMVLRFKVNFFQHIKIKIFRFMLITYSLSALFIMGCNWHAAALYLNEVGGSHIVYVNRLSVFGITYNSNYNVHG